MAVKLVDAMANMREEEALSIAREMLKGGEDPLKILDQCREAMTVVGERFGKGEYFLPELIMAGAILTEVTEIVKPKLTEVADVKRLGKVVVGTVEGDIHDIGKDIVTFMLDVNGFEVHDLGIDVPSEKFVEKIADVEPDVVALSGFLTLAFDSMKQTVEAIKAAGLRDKVKIMIGGGQMDEGVREYAGADAYGADAMEAVSLAKEWVGGK